MKQIMDHANNERFTAQGEEMKKQVIKATDKWYEELKSMPFKSSKYNSFTTLTAILNIEKNGKTINLLKASAKKINPHKRRKVYPLLGNIKSYHNYVEQSQSESQR